MTGEQIEHAPKHRPHNPWPAMAYRHHVHDAIPAALHVLAALPGRVAWYGAGPSNSAERSGDHKLMDVSNCGLPGQVTAVDNVP